MDIIFAKAYIFVLAIVLGFELINKVPSLLHTPLMSATNAIHGIVVVGACIVALTADSTVLKIISFIAVFVGTLNVVGGYVVTHRMLKKFKKEDNK
ncbi:MAG: NAD(P) transhydrogenase subunit alpha [Candidatus Calescibacterium sp.]|nr:NAD(P) transhydrogenase subunit alpha [Candidatus Calescibacterium sp.]